MHAHSTPLQILSSMGTVGFLVFCWLWSDIAAKAVFLLRHTPNTTWEYWLARGLFAGFIGFLIQGATQWTFGDAEVIHHYTFY